MQPEIREATPADAERLLELKLALDSETEFMMLEPGERATEIADEASGPNSVVIVADDGARLVVYVEAQRGAFRRNRHGAYVVIGVREDAAGRGLGRQLLDHLEQWAREAGITRLELTVMDHNARALRLYQRQGYEIEGRRRNSLRVGGRYVDELAMAKLLDARVQGEPISG
jgi:ribosomal protein S18 acetylase RimI-like enzyme